MRPNQRSLMVQLRRTGGLIAAFALCAGAAAAQRPTTGSEGEPANPACTMLTLEAIRTATGVAYEAGIEGDALGEGAGGGASCQWGGASFVPGETRPLLSLVFIPARPRGSYTAMLLEAKPRAGCTRETLRGVGDLAFIESCARGRGLVAYVKTGRNDLIVQMDPERGAPAASARPAVLAVARAAAKAAAR